MCAKSLFGKKKQAEAAPAVDVPAVAAFKKKPLIGVVPLADYQRQSYWMLPGYFHGIEEAGGIPVMLPLTTDSDDVSQLLNTVDGLLFTGGQDVDPTVYGNLSVHAGELTGETSPQRDVMEAKLLGVALVRDIPILGICRGIQSINAMLGGTLWQDLPSQRRSNIEHHGKSPYDKPVHKVEVVPGTPLAACLGAGDLSVNSYHHQAVREIAPGLRIMAWSPDGVVEALYRPASSFLWAVQWHPEFSHETDGASKKIFAAFVSAAARR